VYARWLLNSVLYAGLGATIGAFVCAMAGYAFEKLPLPGKEKLYGVVLLGVLIPSTALVIPLYLLAARTGVAGSFWSVFSPVLVTDQKLSPVRLGLYMRNANPSSYPDYYPLVVTGSLIAVIPLAIGFLMLQRHWRAGLTAGAVK